MIYNDNGKLVFRYDGETLTIEPWGKDSLRVRATRLAKMPDKDWALQNAGGKAVIKINDKDAEISNGKIKAYVDKYGTITFYNDKNAVILREYRRIIGNDFLPESSVLMVDAREFKPINGGDFELTMRFESLDKNEKIYGMGQYQQPYLDIKGMELELAQRNSQASVPFCVSSLGYGMLWNNPAIGRVCFGRNIMSWYASCTKALDYWVTVGDTPAQIVESYCAVTGTVPMLPEYAAGFWQCKLRYQTQEELLEVAGEHKRRGLPISVIVADFFHWPTQGDWRFDPDYWPDPDSMIAQLKEMGIELAVSVWPTVDYKSENFEEMKENGYLISVERGVKASMSFIGRTLFFDATNEDARKYVWGKVKKNYCDKGVNILWLDVAEPEYMPYDFDNYRYHMGPNIQVGNIYPLLYTKGFYDGMKADGKELVSLVRCAWAGSQRYGALLWSGDVGSSFEYLRIQLAAGLNAGMAGLPWWCSDIGGFLGGYCDDPRFRELLVRWFQFGTFNPIMRLHGNRKPEQPQFGTTGGAECLSGAPNEVWSFGDEVYEICKKYLVIRERLRPYIMGYMKEAHEKGTPVMRPLFYDAPEDAASWEVEDQFMFGSDILVAPVFYDGQRSRSVYLPSGKRWKNVWTGEVYDGGQSVNADAALDEIPLFVINGSKIDKTNVFNV
jgi:alpha-D-xyloside xylohydrolase